MSLSGADALKPLSAMWNFIYPLVLDSLNVGQASRTRQHYQLEIDFHGIAEGDHMHLAFFGLDLDPVAE